MNAVVEIRQAGALAVAQNNGRMAVADIISHVAMVQEVMRAVMKPDVHYGVIPGTDKPTLFKQGAEVLCMAFRVADSYHVEDLSTADTVRYRVTCAGNHQITGIVLGSGMGEASSSEEKYKWRKAFEPEFNETPANMRRKKSGYNKQKRESYSTFQVRTEPADLANTILKMANKRAKIAMTINVTACGDMFGQDLEDMDEALRDHLTRHEGEGKTPQAGQTEATPVWPDDAFAKQLPKFRKAIADGKTIEEIFAWAETKGKLTDAQKAEIRKPATANTAPEANAIQIAERMGSAKTEDALNEAAELIGALSIQAERDGLNQLYDAALEAIRITQGE